jgi:hypothetical protein
MPAAKKVVRRNRGRLDRDAQKAREVAIIADLKAGHMSYREIAQKHGVSLPTVNAKARKANIRRPRGRRRLVPAAASAAARGRQAKAVPAVKKPARKRRVRTAAGRRPGRPIRPSSFMEAFRSMVLEHFPNLTLKQYDRLVRLVQAETGV